MISVMFYDFFDVCIVWLSWWVCVLNLINLIFVFDRLIVVGMMLSCGMWFVIMVLLMVVLLISML